MVNPLPAPQRAHASGRLRWSWLTRITAGAVMALVIVLYFWTAQSPVNSYEFTSKAGGGYYPLLAEGFSAGHLFLPIEPSPELLKLKDPYDPAQIAPKLHDASLYEGKYYLYFGASPAIALFLPWRLLSGAHIPENFASALFCALGFLIWCRLLYEIVRRHFPRTSGFVFVIGVVVLGLGNMCPVMLRRAAFWEIPIAGAYFFTTVCFWAAYRAAASRRYALRYLAIASTALVFAIGARPGWVFCAVGISLLGVALAVLRRRQGQALLNRRSIVTVLAAGFPVAVGVLGVLLYNYERFGNPTEFGTTYQLAGHNMHTWKMLDTANVPINLYYYFFSPAQFTVYFPFFDVIGNSPFKPPSDYYGQENVYGAIPNLPFVLLAVLAPGAVLLFRRQRPARPLILLAALLGFAFIAGLPVLLRYAAAASRYMVDFVPSLLGLALIGVLVGETYFAQQVRWRRGVFRASWIVLAGYTAVFGYFVSLQHNDLLRAHNPAVYARYARFFNHVSPFLERLTGAQHGPIELQLRLPTDQSHKLQPLVVTGISFRADYVYLYYTDADHFQIGFEHTGRGGVVSQPIPIDYNSVVSLRIEMGSLYPPETHPYFAGHPISQVRELKQRIKIWVNDVPYIDTNASFNESSPKNVVIGSDPIYGAFGRRFSGQIIAQKRSELAPTTDLNRSYGPLRLAVQFPADKTGKHEPLVVTGVTGRGDIFYVSYLDEKSIQLAIDHWGVNEVKSPPIPISYDRIYLFEIDLGSLHPTPAGPITKRGFLSKYSIKMDHRTVMEGDQLFHPSDLEHISVATNPIGGSTAAEFFSGKVLAKKFLGPAAP